MLLLGPSSSLLSLIIYCLLLSFQVFNALTNKLTMLYTLHILFIGRLGSLIFLSIATSDSGSYTCEAVNEELNVGKTGSLHEVKVIAPSSKLHRTRIKIVIIL